VRGEPFVLGRGLPSPTLTLPVLLLSLLLCWLQILGDRSLKYKYINPNLLFVATAPGSSAGFGSEDSSLAARKPALEDQQVSVALINTVTGAVLHQQVHSAATGPVHAVVSEHWVVYSLRDAVSMRQQVSGPCCHGDQGGNVRVVGFDQSSEQNASERC